MIINTSLKSILYVADSFIVTVIVCRNKLQNKFRNQMQNSVHIDEIVSIVRYWSLITWREGLQNGKITSPKLFAPPSPPPPPFWAHSIKYTPFGPHFSPQPMGLGNNESLNQYILLCSTLQVFCIILLLFTVGETDLTLPVGHLLKQSPWWPILEAAFTEAGHEVVRDCYLEDYVRMVYKPQSSEELKEFEVSVHLDQLIFSRVK